jgi:hypothetical protein
MNDNNGTLEDWVNACGDLWPDVVAAAGAETSYRSIIFRHFADSVRVFYGETPSAWALAALAQGVTKLAAAQVSGSGCLLTIDLEHDGRWYIRAQEMHHGGLRLLGSGDDLPAACLAVAQKLWGGSDE